MKPNLLSGPVEIPSLKPVDLAVALVSLLKGIVEVYFLVLIASSLAPNDQQSTPFGLPAQKITYVLPLLLLLYIFFSFLLSAIQGTALTLQMNALRHGYFQALSQANYEIFQSRKQSDWEVSLSLVTEQGNVFLMRRLQFFAGLAAISVTLGALFILSSWVAMSAIAVISLLLLFAIPLRKQIGASSEARSRQGVVLGSSVRDLMSLRDEMRPAQVERSSLILKNQLSAESETFGLGFRYSQMTLALFMTGIFTIAGVIALLTANRDTVIEPEIAAALLLALRMLLYSQSIADLLSSRSRFLGTLNEVNRLFEPPPSRLTSPSKSSCTESRLSPTSGKVIISLKHAKLTQQSAERNFVLSIPSLTIQERDIVRVEGESGTGKSTLLRALFGLTNIDGESYFHKSYKAAFVGQSPVLLRTSLRENFTVFDETLNDKQIWELLELMHLGKSAGIWPDGLDTRLDSSRMELSGGQIQRVSLARALTLGTNTLFLDEPVSALDHHTSTSILKSIRAEFTGLTIVYTSHQDIDHILRPTKVLRINAT